MASVIRSAREGAVSRITLASPDTRNVMNAGLAREFLAAIAEADADPAINAILIDAEGSIFCGGLDFTDPPPDELFAERVTKPVIAAVQGVVLSAGVALLARAHIAIAAQGSSFGLTDIREARIDPRVNASVAQVLGLRRSRELALTGRIFTTPDALNWGLIHAAVPAFELDDRASAIAQGISRADPGAVLAIFSGS